MNYFLKNPQPQKPMPDEDLTYLARKTRQRSNVRKKTRKDVVAVPLIRWTIFSHIFWKIVDVNILMFVAVSIILSPDF